MILWSINHKIFEKYLFFWFCIFFQLGVSRPVEGVNCGVIMTILSRKSIVLIWRLSNCTGIGTSKNYGVFRWRKAWSIRIGCRHIHWDINLHLDFSRHFSLSIHLTITFVKYKECITFCKSHLNHSKSSNAITNWYVLNLRVSNWILQDMIANEQI